MNNETMKNTCEDQTPLDKTGHGITFLGQCLPVMVWEWHGNKEGNVHAIRDTLHAGRIAAG